MNWKGKSLVSYEITFKLIGYTKTENGLKMVVRLTEY